ncbi:MAG TPA: hypothetical protein VGE69_04015 [Pseudomonadales bacterium]
MKPVASVLLASLACAAAAQAEVPVLRGQQLDVPSAVVLTDAGPTYYGDVRFTANADGSFTLAKAEPRKLALVESATVSVNGDTATVTARGELTIACVALEEPAVARKDATFYVVLAETPIDPLAICMPFVGVTKFTQEVEIDLAGLEPGTYRIDVNGVIANVTIPEVSI